MSNSFAAYVVSGFQGVTARLPVKLPAGFPTIRPPFVAPSVVPVYIDWNIYWQLANQASNIGVNVNLQAASVQANILDRIASVKIDNTGSPNSVYVQFPDTGDVINCPPNCSVTFPCLTNELIANVYVDGLVAGFIPQVRVFFYNVILPPAVDYELNQSIDLWKASPAITRGTTILNENYSAPALGDQLFSSANLALVGLGNTGMWKTPYSSGFLYITSLQVNVQGVEASAASSLQIVIESTGVAGNLLTLFADFPTSNVPPVGVVPIIQLNGLQTKLDATQTWRMRVVSIGNITLGTVQAVSSFTTNPT